MGVESVSVAEALCHAVTLEISCHSPTRVLLPALEFMESKRHTSYRSYSTNVYIQNHWRTAVKYWKDCTNSNYTLFRDVIYNYIYYEDNTAYDAKYWWYNGTQNKNQDVEHSALSQYPTNRNPAHSLQENESVIWEMSVWSKLFW